MSYTVKIKDGDVWSLEAPDGTVLDADNDLPVTTPTDIEDAVESHAANRIPIATNDYEVIDLRE